MMINLGAFEYNPADVLGNGAFAIVYKGRVKNNPDEPVAIKIMLKDQNVLKSKTLLSKEICVLKDLNHDNIVRLYDYSISSSGVYLVMEYCNGGDLSEYLQAKRTLPEETIRHFLIQIGSAMDAMNRKGFMHRDLKPGNILLSHCRDCGQHVTEIPGYLLSFKLADFGFARFLQDGMMAVTMCGSPMYMAPEVLMCRKYDAVADIWSMGIIVYQCLTGKAPFYANTPEALKNIYEKTVCLKPKIPVTTSKALRDLLLQMLIRKPTDRIDFQNFLNHPFLHQRHFEPQGSDLAPSRSNTGPFVPSRNRSTLQTGPVGFIGYGTGEGPYYLVSRDNNRNRDITPQGKKSNHPLDRAHYFTDPRPSNQADFNGFPHQEGPHFEEQPILDEMDDEMTKTTVDEYIEDEPECCGLIQEPRYLAENLLQLQNTQTAFHNPYSTKHENQEHQQQQRAFRIYPNTDPRTGYLVNTDLQFGGDLPLDDYVIVNSDGSEVQRLDNQQGLSHVNPHSNLSNIGRIVRNPGTYTKQLYQQYAQRSGSALPMPMPDVTCVDHRDLPGKYPAPNANLTPIRNFNDLSSRSTDRPSSQPLPVCRQSPSSLQKINRTQLEVNKTLTNPTTEQSKPVQQTSFEFSSHSRSDGKSSQDLPQLPMNDSGPPQQQKQQQHHGQKIGSFNPYRLGMNYPVNGQLITNTHIARLLTRERRSFTAPSEFPVPRLEHESKRPHSGAGLLEYATAARNFENEVGIWDAGELTYELVMEPEHNEELKKITMVLELCELLSELAERRSSALADCNATQLVDEPTTGDKPKSPNPPQETANQLETIEQTGTDPIKHMTKHNSTGLKFVSEAQRIVEQIVLYRRVLYYLEYVFVQFKKAVQNGRLKSTQIALRRLSDCNALYHRCYIRLRQLTKQSKREDLIEPVGRLLVNITANRLIFQYALDQCYAAEMDEYIGELALSLQRYKAGITLIHGLCQHAKTQRDKTILSDCMRLLRDRYACLWANATKNNPTYYTPHQQHQSHLFNPSANNAIVNSNSANCEPDMLQPDTNSPISNLSNSPIPQSLLNPGLGEPPVAINFGLAGAVVAGGTPIASSPLR